MRPDQCALLQRIAQGDENFGNDNFKDPSARSQFTRMIERLQELESAGWITLTTKRAEMHRDKPWYDAIALITEEGEQALADTCADAQLSAVSRLIESQDAAKVALIDRGAASASLQRGLGPSNHFPPVTLLP
jgi:hypothetical protein